MEAGARQLGHTSSPDLISPTTWLFLYLSPLHLSFPLFLYLSLSFLQTLVFLLYSNLTLLFFLHLFTSSSISPCLPLFSIYLFFISNSFHLLSFSISSSSSTAHRRPSFVFFHAMSYSSFVFIYLPTLFILHLFFLFHVSPSPTALPFTFLFLFLFGQLSFPLCLLLPYLFFSFSSIDLHLLIPLSRTSLFN
jgi:hypothetical protein